MHKLATLFPSMQCAIGLYYVSNLPTQNKELAVKIKDLLANMFQLEVVSEKKISTYNFLSKPFPEPSRLVHPDGAALHEHNANLHIRRCWEDGTDTIRAGLHSRARGLPRAQGAQGRTPPNSTTRGTCLPEACAPRADPPLRANSINSPQRLGLLVWCLQPRILREEASSEHRLVWGGLDAAEDLQDFMNSCYPLFYALFSFYVDSKPNPKKSQNTSSLPFSM